MFSLLKTSKLLLINQYAQMVINRDEILNWFISLTEENKQCLVKELWLVTTQAGVVKEDIPIATLKAGLKPTHTPVVILNTGNISLHKRGYELANLKGTVLKQAFLLVLECFAIAERRKKANEGNVDCNHWWHKDLSDKKIVEEILLSDFDKNN